MKILCQQSELLTALQATTRAAAGRSTTPVLECVKLSTQGDALVLTCTDLAISIEYTLPAQVQEAGELLLPNRLFLEIIRKLPAGELSLQSGANMAATIRSQGSRTNLQGMAAQEFPALPDIEETNTVVMEQSLLKTMIHQTAFAVAVEETRPILTGVLLRIEGKRMTMVALDGFRMALRRGDLSSQVDALSAVVPGKYIGEIARMLGDEEGEISLGFSPTHLMADLGGARIMIRLLDGEFVKYEQLIPTEQKLQAKVKCQGFADCVDRASLMAREGKNNLIRLHLDENHMVITSNSDMGDIHEELPIEMSGGEMDIAFNVRYVSDALKSLSEDEMLMRFNTAVSPCVLTPLQGDAYLYLLLPVRVYGA